MPKIKYIIVAAVIIICVIVIITSLDSNIIESSNFQSAKATSKIVRIYGKWQKDKPLEYMPEKPYFTFYLMDELYDDAKIVFKGTKPESFNTASSLVVKGKMVGDSFVASEILTKCPSKYSNE